MQASSGSAAGGGAAAPVAVVDEGAETAEVGDARAALRGLGVGAWSYSRATPRGASVRGSALTSARAARRGRWRVRARSTTTMCATRLASECPIRARLPSPAASPRWDCLNQPTRCGNRWTAARSSTPASCPACSWRACSTPASATSSSSPTVSARASSSATVRAWAKGGRLQVLLVARARSAQARGRAHLAACGGSPGAWTPI